MATFIEVMCPGEQRQYVRSRDIQRIEAPKGLGPADIASPDEPVLLHLHGGGIVPCFAKSPMAIMLQMMEDERALCALFDQEVSDAF